jgi:DNA polymerase III epsilon subunit-like protein
MQIFSIDLETTGLDPDLCQILEIGVVVDDYEDPKPLEELPTFHCYVCHTRIKGDPYALQMNSEILRKIAFKKEEDGWFLKPEDAVEELKTFILSHSPDGPIAVAGKNFANFDLRFLREIGFDEGLLLHHRFLDVGSMFVNPRTDLYVPGLDECLRRAGIEKKVPHNAVEDAMLVIEAIRAKFT